MPLERLCERQNQTKLTMTQANNLLDRIRRRLEERLEGAFDDITGDGYGDIVVKTGSIRYNSKAPGELFPISMKIEMSATNSDGSVETKGARDFSKYAVRYGLDPDDLGKTFQTFAGTEYEIIGLNTRARKYPINCRRTDGKRYKLTAREVIGSLARAS